MKSELKFTAIKILKFIIIFLIVDFFAGSISKKIFFNQKTGKFERSTYLIKEANEDIIIFGSSHAHRHFVPEVIEVKLSKKCYNAGAEGQQLLYHRALQKMLFKRTLPELIILNIDENFLFKSDIAHDRLSDLHPYYSDYKDELRPILGLNSEFVDFKLFFKSYQTNSTLVHAIKYNLLPQIDYKGYRPLFDEMTLINLEKYKTNNSKKEFIESIDDTFVNTLKEFIVEAKSKNVGLLFITSPNLISRDVSNNRSFQKIKEIATSENVVFIDFLNSSKYLNKLNLFHDPSHLNDKGARIFTDSVAELIRLNLKITKHK